MRKIRIALALAAVMVVVGCKPPSMNLQRSGIRAGTDLAITAALDASSAGKVDARKAKVKEVCDQLEALLDGGTVPDMALGAFEDLLKRVVPADLGKLRLVVMGALYGVKVPTDKIGANNVKRVRAAVNQARIAVDAYAMEDRKED